jgi:flagellar biosynthesis/type III secretory pathway protein FliH
MRRLTADHLHTDAAPRMLAGRVVADTLPSAPAPDPDAAARRERDAFDAACRAGHAAGMREAEQEIEARVAKVEQRLQQAHDAAVARLHDERQRLAAVTASVQATLAAHEQGAESLAVEVAYAALVRVLGAMHADATLLPDVCRAIVDDYGRADATLVLGELDFARVADVDLGLPVRADARLRPGQCVIDTPRGQFETGLDVRTEALRRALLDALATHEAAT